MNPKKKSIDASAKNTKAEILKAYQELKEQLAKPKKTAAKTPESPSEALESEIKQLTEVQKQVSHSLNQIFEALITKTRRVTDLINAGREEEEKNQRRRRREEEEYQFDLSLNRKKAEAEFTEKLSAREKALEEKENLLREKEDEFEQLQIQADGFAKQIEQAVKQTSEQLNAEHKKEKEIENRLSTQKHESELGLAKYKIQALEEIKEKQSKEINNLKDQLARATREVKEIAVAVIESRGKAEKTKEEEKETS